MAAQPAAALLLVDLRRGLVDATPGGFEVLDRVARAADGARAAGVHVVWVAGQSAGWAPGDPAAELHDRLAPAPDDLTVQGPRSSAFSGTGLQATLAAWGVEQVAVAGLTTGGAVLATARAALDLGYRVQVLADVCADADHEVQRVLLDHVLPPAIEVLAVDAWLATPAAADPA